MIDSSLINVLGSTGVLAWLVIQRLMDNKKKVSGTFTESDRKKLDHLHDLHDVYDEDRVPVWYVRKGLERAIEAISESLAKLTEINAKMLEELRYGDHENRSKPR